MVSVCYDHEGAQKDEHCVEKKKFSFQFSYFNIYIWVIFELCLEEGAKAMTKSFFFLKIKWECDKKLS